MIRTMGRHYWYKPYLAGGKMIDLITQPHFQALPDGTVLWSTSGEEVVKGIDDISTAVRDGFMAFGLPNLAQHRVPYRAFYRET